MNEQNAGDEKRFRVTAVITTCRREWTVLERAIRSVMAQTYPIQELLLIDDNDPDSEYSRIIRDKVKAIIDKTEELDQMLESASKDWKLSRVGKAELAILRVGAYEIRFDDDIPEKVAINEALELAKKYCDEKAVSFINGVLNQLLTQTE